MARSDDFWLARLLPKSDVRFIGLPTEYGLVTAPASRLPVSIMGTVVAFHVGNATSPVQLTCELVNQATEPRVFFPDRLDISTITALSMTYEIEAAIAAGADPLSAETKRKDGDILPVDARLRVAAKAPRTTHAPLSGKKAELARELDELMREQGG